MDTDSDRNADTELSALVAASVSEWMIDVGCALANRRDGRVVATQTQAATSEFAAACVPPDQGD